MSDSTTDPWDRVRRWFIGQIRSQGLSLRDVEGRAGVNYRTLKKLSDGEPVKRMDRLAVLAMHLGFEGDTFDRLLEGEEPVRLSPEEVDRLHHARMMKELSRYRDEDAGNRAADEFETEARRELADTEAELLRKSEATAKDFALAARDPGTEDGDEVRGPQDVPPGLDD